jgi:predicted DNA-binding protein
MLSIRLNEFLENKINSYSKEHNKTKSDIVKEALMLYFKIKEQEDKKSAYELGKELFGKYSSNRGDLSTTYKQKLKQKLNEKYSTNR